MKRLTSWKTSSAISIALLLLTLAVPALADITIPANQGFVTDAAGALRADARAWLTANCEALQQQKQVQLAVLIVPDLQGTTVEDFAQKTYDKWKIGDKDTRKGVLFLVAVNDRKVRIQVGYGLEGDLPDGKIGGIRDQAVLPSFRAQDISGGVMSGVAAVMSAIGAAPVEPPSTRRVPRRPREKASPLVMLLVFLFVVGLCTVSPFWRFMILDMLLRGSSGGSGSSGGFSGGSGFGGFGGGSSGGGGASGSW